MAGAVELTSADFGQIKDNLINYLKSTREFTDFDFEGSNLQVILNLLAYQQQLNAYSINMLANESFLTSSSVRNNTVINARQIGYLPNSAKAARSTISFSFQLSIEDYPQGFPRFLEIQPGVAFQAGTGQGAFMFNILDIYVAPVDSEGKVVFKDVDIYEGAFLTHKFIVDKTNYTQRFILENQNIDTSTIRIEVQEDPNLDDTEYYVPASNLVDVDENDRIYWIDEDEARHYELTFGDGYFGKALNDNSIIHVTYVVTNGFLGNGIQGTEIFNFVGRTLDSNKVVVTSPATITSVNTSNGGAELESVPSIKFRAPKFHAAQNRCVTATDYEAIVRKVYPSVQGIYVYGGETLPIPEFGRVYIAIKPLLGDTLSNITKSHIKKSLEDYRIASLDICIIDPNVLYAEIDSLVYYDEKRTIKDSSAIDCVVTDTLLEYANSLSISKFGGAVRYSRIVGAIDDCDPSITRNQTRLRMRKDVKALLNTKATYEVCFENAFELNCNRSVVYSTWFYLSTNGVPDRNTKYYIEDIPQSGKLRLFYFNSLNQKVTVDAEIGTVDYEIGELKIGYQKGKDLTIIDTEIPDGRIEFRAFPRDLDIIAKHSVYLSLDIAKSTIEATPDTRIGEP